MAKDNRYEELLASGVTDVDASRMAFEELSESDSLMQELRRLERPIAQEPVV